MAFLAIAGAVVSAVGAIQQGQSQAAAARYNAQIAQQNSVVAQQQGEAASEQQQIASRRKIGSMVASYGASGVDGGSGSPMDVLADSVRAATLDNLTLNYNYKLKSMGLDNQATLDESNAKNAATSGTLNGIGAAMKGFGSAIPQFSSTQG